MSKLIPVGFVVALAAIATAVVFAAAGGSATATGTLTGKITDGVTNQAQAGLCATAVDTAGNFTPAGVDARGKYTLTLPAGPYEVFFSDCGGSPNQYVPEVFKNHVGLDSDRTDAVDVVAGQTAKANGSLEHGGSISVHLQDAAGHPLEGLVCPLYTDDNAQDSFCVFTDSTGNATMGGIPTGPNRVSACANGQCFFYNQKTVFWASDTVAVAAGHTTGPLTFVFPSAAQATRSFQSPTVAGHIVLGANGRLSVSK